MAKTKNPRPPVPGLPLPMSKTKTIEELAAEQGVKLPQNLDELLGKGCDLWDDDEDFENFLRWLEDSTSRR
jgi:hypothetical protein